ncbi:metallophosphoesterase [Microbulbifer marinus]|uniref:Calcineurin-like phosphoesterase n=1 Tax=Microbulbifer marinus TaxID=658218 RepID=A0A1H3WFN9_9GAMM|nr:metallophosphoesterase [Microbulbifer marinus]SDZ85913.1 Calcineurin-like phosphoesterase [Microbulbifer marinus]
MREIKEERVRGYDIIGDIHGHAQVLENLLEHLGYGQGETGYSHPNRKVVFLGDFIDRGEELREHRRLLDTVMAMVENGHAHAVMGNHEFNALAFHTINEGKPLRAHDDKNIKQHQAFLNEFAQDPDEKARVLAFFYRLPLWLELELGARKMRAVHACWSEAHLRTAQDILADARLSETSLISASEEGTALFEAVEVLLKGYETSLPEGITFLDKDKNVRDAVRVQWWKDTASTLGEVALPLGVDLQEAAALPVPRGVPRYGREEVPCFIGHYWLNGAPGPLADNVACLDYSIAKSGKLVAYRWSGEQSLDRKNFTWC